MTHNAGMATVLEAPPVKNWLDSLNTAQRAAATHGSPDGKGAWSAGPNTLE